MAMGMAGIEELLRELGIDYKIQGKEAGAPCPFHSPDRHPSWSINTRNGLYHCFSCGASGNIAHLAAHIRGLAYHEALILVNSRIGWVKAGAWKEEIDHKNYAPPSFKVSEADLSVFPYPSEDKLKQKRITLDSAKRYGVRWNTERESWVFPVRDPYTNELWGWQSKNEREFRNYPSGVPKSRTLFGLDALGDERTVILVESPVDAVRLDAAGFRGGVSSFGVSVSDFQLSLVHERAERLVLALDNDSAGISETARIAAAFHSIDVSVFNYLDAEGKDPGELSDPRILLGIIHEQSALTWLRKYKEEK